MKFAIWVGFVVIWAVPVLIMVVTNIAVPRNLGVISASLGICLLICLDVRGNLKTLRRYGR